MKKLVFLPDREGRDELSQMNGFVRVGADGAALKSLSDRLVLPPDMKPQADMTMWRGVLALALLCDAWPECGVKTAALEVDGTASLFASWVLSARPEAGKGRQALSAGCCGCACGLEAACLSDRLCRICSGPCSLV